MMFSQLLDFKLRFVFFLYEKEEKTVYFYDQQCAVIHRLKKIMFICSLKKSKFFFVFLVCLIFRLREISLVPGQIL